MQHWPTTRNTLLVKLAGDEFEAAWLEFSRQYEPAIYRFARKRGLQHTDAVDLAQQVMLSVMKSAQAWSEDQPPEHFRGWLKRVASNRLINMVTRDAKHRGVGGSAQIALDRETDGSDRASERLWAQEEERSILRAAAENIRSEFVAESWTAFEQTLLGGKTVEAVAAELGKTAGAIYASRARIMRRLKQESLRLKESEQ